jgi:hypothetical protein
MKLPTQTQPFNDGIVNIYSVKNTADAGNMPKEDGLTLKVGSLRFEERVVGMGRYWTALQEQARIEQLLRVPRINSVNVHDVAILNGQQYNIMQVQYPPDVKPPCMDLSLERLEVAYEVN